MTKFEALCEELTKEIQLSYEESITIPEAEILAGKFLNAQIQVSKELKNVDLDFRMKKSGVKAVKAAVYMEAATKDAKKPSDVMIAAIVDLDKIVQDQQKLVDEAEVQRDLLHNYLNIFKEAHVHFRSIARGRFE